MGKTSVAKTNDVAPGKAIAVDVNGRKIALFNLAGKYYAINDECTHASGPLSEGEIQGTTVVCPWHGGMFDICSGTATGEPAVDGVKSYNVTVEGDKIFIEL